MNLGEYIVPIETKNGICVDIGCNLGDFTNTCPMLNQITINQIYFVEAQTELFNNLIERFKDDENIIGKHNAVWSESGLKVDLVSHPNNDHGSVAVNGDFINNDWTEKIVLGFPVRW